MKGNVETQILSFSACIVGKKRSAIFPSCGKFSKHKNRVQTLGNQNRMTNIPYRESSKKLPLMVKVQSPLRLELRNLEKCLEGGRRTGKLLRQESKASTNCPSLVPQAHPVYTLSAGSQAGWQLMNCWHYYSCLSHMVHSPKLGSFPALQFFSNISHFPAWTKNHLIC